MVVKVVLHKLKSLILLILSLLGSAICCFRRRRSYSHESEPLTHVGVVSNKEVIEKWDNNWDNVSNSNPKTVQDYIELYRQKAVAAVQEENMLHQEDLFEDMTPKITKQTKVYIDNIPRGTENINRLSLTPQNVNIIGADLEEWEANCGWERQTEEWDAQELLREKKKQERGQKIWEQQLRRQEKVARPLPLGARLTS